MRAGRENGLVFPNTTGTSGQTLVTNGSGGFTWGTPLSLTGDAGDILFNTGSAIGAAQFVNVENGYLKLMTGLPGVGGAGGAILGSKDLGTRIMPAFVGPNGLDTTIQPHMGRNKVFMISPTSAATTVSVLGGIPAPTLLVPIARTPSATSMMTSLTRIGFATNASTTTNLVAGIRIPTLMWMRGPSSGIGGFHLQCTFTIPDTVATTNKRMFIGLYGTLATPTNVDPAGLLNTIGVGKISGNNNLQLISNSGSGTATLVDFGTGFPATGVNTGAVYLLTLFSPAGGTFVGWRIDRLDTSTTLSGTITSSAAMPVSTSMMAFTAWVTNNGTANITGFDLSNLYVETDN